MVTCTISNMLSLIVLETTFVLNSKAYISNPLHVNLLRSLWFSFFQLRLLFQYLKFYSSTVMLW